MNGVLSYLDLFLPLAQINRLVLKISQQVFLILDHFCQVYLIEFQLKNLRLNNSNLLVQTLLINHILLKIW